MEVMADGRWVTGKSHAAIAAEFKVADKTVSDWAAEASRHLLLLQDAEDFERRRAKTVAAYEALRVKALDRQAWTEKGGYVDAPDVSSAVRATDGIAKAYGIDKQGASMVAVQVNIMDTPDGKRLLASLRKRIAPLPGGVEALELVAADLELDEP